jgi:hypothetical protein
MDGNKNRVDFVITLTRNQAVWFDARTGNGTYQVNPFPNGPANGFDNPFLLGPWDASAWSFDETDDTSGAYEAGLLVCFAVDGGQQAQIKWNHLSGTATVYDANFGTAYEYSAYAFYAPAGPDLDPIGTPGTLNLNGVEYDACPQYQIGQFAPAGTPIPGRQVVFSNRLTLASCTLLLNQDWVPVFTKLEFDVWNEDEVKFTGAFECADSWHEIFFEFDLDAGAQSFFPETLDTDTARYRVQSSKSTQCPGTRQNVGLLGVQSSVIGARQCEECEFDGGEVATTLASAGKVGGRIVWDPAAVVPEGRIR